MKSPETKTEFIALRAQGKTFEYIAKELNISKSTCSAWEKELKTAIADLKQEQLNELYDTYYMTKEARIKKLGDILDRIDNTLDQADLTEVPLEKLLDFKLKYTEALKAEYVHTSAVTDFSEQVTAQDILKALGSLLERVQRGEVSQEQANRESTILANLLKAFDAVELQEKLAMVESVLKSRS
ncbi:helix-turn-helix domain containing protein (plasmid) [Streptococcus suis]|uniref:helix-turn-helix domain containing protein n=1 Tax=Streptococcus suis TaxID=1307 RepID=UPI001F1C5E98|nr:helix-turn-helix domain containing protein [Streptococcus suis]MCE6987438.1 helix-turn-helix domain containing protein [Streptococcus suis]